MSGPPGSGPMGGTPRDRHPRTELGAYVLGALEPAERREVDRHLEDCHDCRDEVSRLSVLPSLLDRLSAEEATADYAAVEAGLDRLVERAGEEDRRQLRRQLQVWRSVAAAAVAAAVAVAVIGWAPWEEPPDRLVVRVVPVAQAAASVDGTVAAYAWEWGTTVEIRVADLPPAEAYEIWAIGADGRRERAGTWGPTADHRAMVRGASAIQRHRLARIEVTDPTGTPLFTAEFDERA